MKVNEMFAPPWEYLKGVLQEKLKSKTKFYAVELQFFAEKFTSGYLDFKFL